MKLACACLFLGVVVSLVAGVRDIRPGRKRKVQYEHFDDYLLTISQRSNSFNEVAKPIPPTTSTSTNSNHQRELTRRSHHGRRGHVTTSTPIPTDDEDLLEEDESSGDTTPTESATPMTTPNPAATGLDILGYFQDVPRRHWSCCMLGKLSGDKGFHCHAGFYAARITMRNYNRAHNRRMPLMHGPNSRSHWGKGIMLTFQRCVARHSQEFHKCCYAAAIEKRERQRWSRHRENNRNRKLRQQRKNASMKVIDSVLERNV